MITFLVALRILYKSLPTSQHSDQGVHCISHLPPIVSSGGQPEGMTKLTVCCEGMTGYDNVYNKKTNKKNSLLRGDEGMTAEGMTKSVIFCEGMTSCLSCPREGMTRKLCSVSAAGELITVLDH